MNAPPNTAKVDLILRYEEGTHVLSGSTYLRCEQGIWVDAGTQAPLSP